MSNPRIIVTKRQPVIIGYICSNCGNPIITTIIIQVEVQKVVGLSRSRAESVAIETADQVIQENIKRISTCKETCTSLVDATFGKPQMLEVGLFSVSLLFDVSTPCPNCNNIEHWQIVPSSVRRNLRADSNCYPSVFPNKEAAILWKQDFLTLKAIEIESIRRDLFEVEKATEKTKSLLHEINLLTYEKKSMPEIALKKKLVAEHANAQEKKKRLRLFDFSSRVRLNKLIINNSAAIMSIERLISERIKDIDASLCCKKVELQTAQLLAFGSTGDNNLFCSKTAICFVLEANQDYIQLA
jgi:hypothetical protein